MEVQRKPQQRPSGFTRKKWTLIILTLISIFIILDLVLSIQLIETLIPSYIGTTRVELDASSAYILFGVGVVSILVELMGLLGALKEHYCILMTFGCISIVLAIITGASVFVFTGWVSIWVSFALYCLIGGLSIRLARDIRGMRNKVLEITVVVTNPYTVNQLSGQTGIQLQEQPAWTFLGNQHLNPDQVQVD